MKNKGTRENNANALEATLQENFTKNERLLVNMLVALKVSHGLKAELGYTRTLPHPRSDRLGVSYYDAFDKILSDRYLTRIAEKLQIPPQRYEKIKDFVYQYEDPVLFEYLSIEHEEHLKNLRRKEIK